MAEIIPKSTNRIKPHRPVLRAHFHAPGFQTGPEYMVVGRKIRDFSIRIDRIDFLF